MNGIEKEKNGAISVIIKDATADENQAAIQALGFGSHGLVVYDTNDAIKQKLDGHNLDEADIRKAIDAALAEN